MDLKANYEKMRIMEHLLHVLIIPIIISFLGSKDSQLVKISSSNEKVTIENEYIELDFHLKKGTYQATDKRKNKAGLHDVYFEIEGQESKNDYLFSWEKEEIADQLGKGKKLVLTGKKKGSNTLYFEIVLYQNHRFISLNAGIQNKGKDDIQIKEFFPVRGRSFDGHRFEDYKVLDGESGIEITRVSNLDTLSSRNNVLVTFGKKGAPKHSLVMGGLTYNEFQKNALVIRKEYI